MNRYKAHKRYSNALRRKIRKLQEDKKCCQQLLEEVVKYN